MSPAMATLRLVTLAPASLACSAVKLTLLPAAATTTTACYILPMPVDQSTPQLTATGTHGSVTAQQLQQQQQRPLCPKGTKELLRCKRRIDFAALGYTLPRPHLASVARRNERERNRVKQVNQGFARLRQHVPESARQKKMSKVDTLKAAVAYIKRLQATIDAADDAVSALFLQGPGGFPDAARVTTSAASSGSLSPGGAPPYADYSTDASATSEQLSADDVDLLDFVSWFQ